MSRWKIVALFSGFVIAIYWAATHFVDSGFSFRVHPILAFDYGDSPGTIHFDFVAPKSDFYFAIDGSTEFYDFDHLGSLKDTLRGDDFELALEDFWPVTIVGSLPIWIPFTIWLSMIVVAVNVKRTEQPSDGKPDTLAS